jgi:branched-chain amino acid transport system substrate-binding protein
MKKRNNKGITRRDFIKQMGYTATAVGISSSVPKLLKPARAAQKDHILVGRPIPTTGPVAAFNESTPWLDNTAIAEINKDGGIYIKEAGKKLRIKEHILDTESNPTKAAELASKLALKDKVDLMYASSTPATGNPVSAVCERAKVPCIVTADPLEMWLPGGPYHWSFNAGVSVIEFAQVFLQAWEQVETNKIVGLCAQNDADGVAWAQGAAAVAEPAGYKTIDFGRFPPGTSDYTSQINGWKKENVEILNSNMAPPDFNILWKQCYQMGFKPKICVAGRAALFASTMEALGGWLGLGILCEAIWLPSWPFKSSLTGWSARDLCDAYEKASGKQSNQLMGPMFSGYEILADVLRRAQTLEKEALRKALADTDIDTIQGHTKFRKDNTAIIPAGCFQWVKGKKFKYDAVLVSNGRYKELPLERKTVSLHELRQ